MHGDVTFTSLRCPAHKKAVCWSVRPTCGGRVADVVQVRGYKLPGLVLLEVAGTGDLPPVYKAHTRMRYAVSWSRFDG